MIYINNKLYDLILEPEELAEFIAKEAKLPEEFEKELKEIFIKMQQVGEVGHLYIL